MRRIAIHSVPRSGSTWLGALIDAHAQIIYKYQPLFSYAFKGYLNESSTAKEISDFFCKISQSEDAFIDQMLDKEKGIVPKFSKSDPFAVAYKEVRYHHILENMLKRDAEVKIIGLIRNPLAVMYSWWKAPREFRSDLGWKFEDEWLRAPSKNQGKKEEFNGYLKWKEVATLFLRLRSDYPGQVYVVTYKDLLADTALHLHRIMEFIGLALDKQQEDFIQMGSARHVVNAYSVYKVKTRDDDWLGKLPTNTVEYIRKDLFNTELARFLLT